MDISRIKKSVKIASSGCWEWQKSCNSAGYGQLTVDGVYWLAHRYSFCCENGMVDAEDVVRHKCHNKKCCNPDHLSSGSHKDNWYDSEEIHREASKSKATTWIIGENSYCGLRLASKETGISFGGILRHSKDGVFDVDSYRRACKKARVKPRI